MNWRKSSYSGGEGNCVEVADSGNRVLMRDTQDRTGPVIKVSLAAWRRFAEQVKRSLASDSQSDCRGHSRVRECPLCYARHRTSKRLSVSSARNVL
jgi:uncharacterized protein DUF397